MRLLATAEAVLAGDTDDMTSRHLQDTAARIRLSLDKVMVEQQNVTPPGGGRRRGFEDF